MKAEISDESNNQTESEEIQDPVDAEQDEIARSIKILVKLLMIAEREYEKGKYHDEL